MDKNLWATTTLSKRTALQQEPNLEYTPYITPIEMYIFVQVLRHAQTEKKYMSDHFVISASVEFFQINSLTFLPPIVVEDSCPLKLVFLICIFLDSLSIT